MQFICAQHVYAQGNRGVIVNNHIFDDSGGVKKLHSTNLPIILPSSSTYRPYISSTYRPLPYKISDSNGLKYSESQHSYGINGQVNRGAIVNNRNFDESKPINKIESPHSFSSTTFKPLGFGSSANKPLSFLFSDSNEFKYKKTQPSEFGNGSQVNRAVIINNQKVDELQPTNIIKSTSILSSTRRSPLFSHSNGLKHTKFQQQQQQHAFGTSGQVNRGVVINNHKFGDSIENNQYANNQRVQISNTFKSPAFVSSSTLKLQTIRTSTHTPSSYKFDNSNEFKRIKSQQKFEVSGAQLNRGVIINNKKIDDSNNNNNQYAKLQHSNTFLSTTTIKPRTSVHSTLRPRPSNFHDDSSDLQLYKSQHSNIFKTFSTTTYKPPSFVSSTFRPDKAKLSTFRPTALKFENSSNDFHYSEWEQLNLFKAHSFPSTTTKRPTFVTSTFEPAASMLSTFRPPPLKLDNFSSEYKFSELKYSNTPKTSIFFPTSTKSTTIQPSVVNDNFNEFKYSKPQQIFGVNAQVNRASVINNNQKIKSSSENQYAKPQSTNTVMSSDIVLSSSRQPQWPNEINDSSSSFHQSDLYQSSDTSSKYSQPVSAVSTFELPHFQYENDDDASDHQLSETQYSNIFNALTFLSTTPKPPQRFLLSTFKPTNFKFDDDSIGIEYFESQHMNAIKSPTFPLSTYEPVSFLSAVNSQVILLTSTHKNEYYEKIDSYK